MSLVRSSRAATKPRMHSPFSHERPLRGFSVRRTAPDRLAAGTRQAIIRLRRRMIDHFDRLTNLRRDETRLLGGGFARLVVDFGDAVADDRQQLDQVLFEFA